VAAGVAGGQPEGTTGSSKISKPGWTDFCSTFMAGEKGYSSIDSVDIELKNHMGSEL
jgi:hypothetical protein